MPDKQAMDPHGFVCPRCHSEVLPSTSSGGWRVHKRGVLLHDSGLAAGGPPAGQGESLACAKCQLPLVVDSSSSQLSVAYPYKRLLAELDWRKYLLWALAQNNGLVSYVQLADASCSVDDRQDVAAFAAYISRVAPDAGGSVLDLGCGPLERPGYLKGIDFGTNQMFGLDPFASKWAGTFIQGVSEYLPLPSGSIDMITAATSLDHTFDLDITSAEIARILRTGGSLVIWDHPLPRGLARIYAVQTRLLELRSRLIHGRHVRVYSDGTVIETPRGMADPFHAKPSRRRSWPTRLDRALTAAGLIRQHYDAIQGFSTYTK
ncbi:MAG: methyltransferase domain-containing protein [Actinomycetota bacterium]